MDSIMDGFVIFVFIGGAILTSLAVLWYLIQTVRIIWAYNSFLAIAAVVFSPIVHVIFYFMPKDNFSKYESGLFKKYFLAIVVLFLLGIVAAIVIPATSFQEKLSANKMQNLNPDEIETLANAGDSSAQSRLSAMYFGGTDGVDQDFTKAAVWSQKSADQGDDLAQLILGWLYEEGAGVDQDYAKAAEWLQKSSDQDNAVAQSSLGAMYEGGKGVRQDYNKASKLYQKSADQGNDLAQFRLGVMYQEGNGVRQDYTEASKLYKKAADQDNANAQFLLGIMYQKGNGVRQDYAEAKEWFGKACDNGIQIGCDGYRAL